MNHINQRLNNQVTPIPPAARGKIDTSQDAADSLPDRWRTKSHRTILQLIGDSPEGLTADELEVALGMRACSVTARINELLRSTVVKRSGERRRTRSGRFAHVLILGNSQIGGAK